MRPTAALRSVILPWASPSASQESTEYILLFEGSEEEEGVTNPGAAAFSLGGGWPTR